MRLTLLVVVLALGGCRPADQTDTVSYQNTDVGFSLEHPASCLMQGVAFEVRWGIGFGGACPNGYETVSTTSGSMPVCHLTNADGTESWEQMTRELADGRMLSARAYSST